MNRRGQATRPQFLSSLLKAHDSSGDGWHAEHQRTALPAAGQGSCTPVGCRAASAGGHLSPAISILNRAPTPRAFPLPRQHHSKPIEGERKALISFSRLRIGVVNRRGWYFLHGGCQIKLVNCPQQSGASWVLQQRGSGLYVLMQKATDLGLLLCAGFVPQEKSWLTPLAPAREMSTPRGREKRRESYPGLIHSAAHIKNIFLPRQDPDSTWS